MSMFRARRHDGTERTVHADRVLTDSLHTIFEVRAAQDWQVVLALPTDTVAAVQRRITEVDGRWSWVVERPQHTLGVRHVRGIT